MICRSRGNILPAVEEMVEGYGRMNDGATNDTQHCVIPAIIVLYLVHGNAATLLLSTLRNVAVAAEQTGPTELGYTFFGTLDRTCLDSCARCIGHFLSIYTDI